MTPRSPFRILAGHCDRYLVTPTSPAGRLRCPFFRPVVSCAALEPVRPANRDSTSAPGSARARPLSPDLAFPSADAAAPVAHLRRLNASRRSIVTYVDRTLNCVDCGVEFIHSAADQEYYVQKGFSSDPKRCTSCRASRRAARDGGYDVRDIGGPRGYERGDDRPNREYFAVVCSSCGNQAQVPFKPRMDRPVYCSDCFRTVRPD